MIRRPPLATDYRDNRKSANRSKKTLGEIRVMLNPMSLAGEIERRSNYGWVDGPKNSS